jgi:hypothetical protein
LRPEDSAIMNINNNNIGKSTFIKVEGNGLIGAAGYYDIATFE